jgi:electron transport complex protein RnfG
MREELKERPLTLIGVLGAVCVVAGLAVALVYLATTAQIHAQVESARREALLVVHPNASPEGFELVETDLQTDGRQFTYYKVYDKPLDDNAKKLIGYACEGRAQGYSSTLVVTVGVDRNAQTITGIKVTQQQETPGLGANCEAVESNAYIWDIFSPRTQAGPPEPWFQAQFRGRALDGLVLAGKSYKDVRVLSGATITTNAVVRATLNAVANLRKASGWETDGVSSATRETPKSAEGEDQ